MVGILSKSFSPLGDFAVPKLSSHGIYIPNGCKNLKVFLQLFHGSEANSKKPLKNEKKSLELRD